jgi:hypothetical protein
LAGWNVAVTFFAAVIVTVQVVPETTLHPDHDLKIASGAGAAVSVADDPFATGSVQSPGDPVPQSIPGPAIVPDPDTAAVRVEYAGWNVAVTLFAAVIVTVQVVPETLLHPDHDLKMASAAGVAVSVAVAPFATGSVQSPVDPVVQAMPVPSIVPFPDTTVVSA